MLLVGLTGGIGSGKSTVARLLAERGAAVIDADRVARDVVEPGRPAHRTLVERFGAEILTEDGWIDRPRLAAAAFSDPESLAALNEITHPPIMAAIGERIAALADTDRIVVLDAPLLLEAGGGSMVDVVVVVTAEEEIRLARLARDRTMPAEQARARMAAQRPDREKAADADWIVHNNGTLEALAPQVDALWRALEARRDGRPGPRGPALGLL